MRRRSAALQCSGTLGPAAAERPLGVGRPPASAGPPPILLALLLLVLAAPAPASQLEVAPPVPGPLGPVGECLRQRLEAGRVTGALEVLGVPVYSQVALPAFYESRAFRPAWVVEGRPGAPAGDLLETLLGAGAHGLTPADYHAGAIEALFGRLGGTAGGERDRLLADLDLLLTDAFLIYGSHLLAGRVDPETLDPEWIAVRRERDLTVALDRALAGEGVAVALADLLPDQPGYLRLRRALARYRGLAARGGWPAVPDGPALKPADAAPAVASLRLRLAAEGELADPATADPELYDPALEAAVRRFQERHGLDADGTVGPKTLAALNVPAEARVRQIELNLERWRWLPEDLGERYVLVNIPEFRLRLVEGGSQVMEMRAVVGRPYRRTPVFSDLIRYLVFNPYWDVPTKLAVQDKLPLIREDPGYLGGQGIRVYEGWGAEERAVDPAAVDWSQVGSGRFPYHLRQDPGPKNALGRVKIMFPNRFNVYLHDTPTRDTFARAERDVSSGCIRLEHALDLAESLLRETPGWGPEAIQRVLADYRPHTVTLPRPVPVHILYWTAWAEEDGTVQFRRDLYDRDAHLAAALTEPPPRG